VSQSCWESTSGLRLDARLNTDSDLWLWLFFVPRGNGRACIPVFVSRSVRANGGGGAPRPQLRGPPTDRERGVVGRNPLSRRRGFPYCSSSRPCGRGSESREVVETHRIGLFSRRSPRHGLRSHVVRQPFLGPELHEPARTRGGISTHRLRNMGLRHGRRFTLGGRPSPCLVWGCGLSPCAARHDGWASCPGTVEESGARASSGPFFRCASATSVRPPAGPRVHARPVVSPADPHHGVIMSPDALSPLPRGARP
jgi:hypothetical protein